MKRLLLTAAAGLMIAGPLSLPASAQQGYQYQGQDHNRDWNRDNHHNDRDWNSRGQRQVSKYHGNNEKWRDTRRNARWNDRDYNGYYIGNAWHRGRPSTSDYNRRGFALGYQPWQRGDRLGSYNNRYQEVDYRDYRLQRPPQGYRWVKDDNNDLILAAVVGGLIAAIISNNY
jgi:Ni/Co efflux regulator RcnB